MAKDKLQLLSPLFLKYQSDFEKNPRSRVFAPLAESYRKLGMVDKAMEILSQGIRFHPSYVMGYLGLAFCYFDLKQFNLAHTTLRPLVDANRDNLRLQRLFADICLELGKKDEALDTLKYLLFINPRDKEVAELVKKTETEIEEKYRPAHRPIIIPEKELSSQEKEPYFDLKKLTPAEPRKFDFDDWMTVDLAPKTQEATQTTKASSADYDQWNMKKNEVLPQESVEKKAEKIHEPINNEAYNVHLNLEDEIEQESPAQGEEETPLVTHTLVDLYCGQGHIEKALEVLEKILILNPNDQRTINKIKEIKALAQPLEQFEKMTPVMLDLNPAPADNFELHSFVSTENEQGHEEEYPKDLKDLEEVTEDEGRRHLMSIIDEKLGPINVEEVTSKHDNVKKIEERLTLFLKKIQKRALDYQSRV